jgi:hypothetical protein
MDYIYSRSFDDRIEKVIFPSASSAPLREELKRIIANGGNNILWKKGR